MVNLVNCMKPTTKVAMYNLIQEARKRIPFNISFDGNCEGRCDECPMKRLEFLDIELKDWEGFLKKGNTPSLTELETVARNCKEVYAILCKEGFIKDSLSTE